MIPPRAAWRVTKPTAQPALPSLDGLLEENTDAIPVRITLVQDDVTTGWDDGALGFEDDAVWFSGRATSFRLAAPDILPGAYILSRREPVTSGEALNQGFPLRHPTRKVWVRVRVLTRDEEEKVEHERRLIAGVKRLRSGAGSPSSEERAGGGTVGEGVHRKDQTVTAAPDTGVISKVKSGRCEGTESEYPPLTPRPGLMPPLRAVSGWQPSFFRRHRIVFGLAGALALTASSLFPGPQARVLSSILSVSGMALLLNLYAFEGDRKPETAALRRIADEESASTSP